MLICRAASDTLCCYYLKGGFVVNSAAKLIGLHVCRVSYHDLNNVLWVFGNVRQINEMWKKQVILPSEWLVDARDVAFSECWCCYSSNIWLREKRGGIWLAVTDVFQLCNRTVVLACLCFHELRRVVRKQFKKISQVRTLNWKVNLLARLAMKLQRIFIHVSG